MHIEFFDGIEGIADAKAEIFDGLEAARRGGPEPRQSALRSDRAAAPGSSVSTGS
ncbi:MAG: hypothetical protein ACMVO3_22095 [Thalassobaculum sp.]